MREIPPLEHIRCFRQKMLDWLYKYGRDYPWRHTDDPFKILIAEIMLRRTKADQVKPVYITLFDKYPNVENLAGASDEQLDKILYPLGLKWRSPAFKLVAIKIIEKYNSKVPEAREELISLPGVGDYVAGAVLAIAFEKEEWMVDSNIVRLFKRYFGVDTSRAFRDYLNLVGIGHILAAPFHPQTNGKVERYQQSLKRVVNQLPYELPSQLEKAIADFVDYYNYRRYHKALGDVTPADILYGRREEILKRRREVRVQTINRRKDHNRGLREPVA